MTNGGEMEPDERSPLNDENHAAGGAATAASSSAAATAARRHITPPSLGGRRVRASPEGGGRNGGENANGNHAKDGVSGGWVAPWAARFECGSLEALYWRASWPQQRARFCSGLLFGALVAVVWLVFVAASGAATAQLIVSALLLMLAFFGLLAFTRCERVYARFYLPAAFVAALLASVFSLSLAVRRDLVLAPFAVLATSVQVVLLIYSTLPLSLWLCGGMALLHSVLFLLFSVEQLQHSSTFVDPNFTAVAQDYRADGIRWTPLFVHIGAHLLGFHLYVLTQVRQRKTFLNVGQSLMARRDLEVETLFKDNMIQSVMPKKVADELLKDVAVTAHRTSSLGSSHPNEAARNARGSKEGGGSATGGGGGGEETSGVRKFRPFTMNCMENVSILFADIAGFTRMSANKSASELVDLLNDLFARFDALTRRFDLEKISTLGDCYYCVAGCPEPRDDHAKCCVQMGLSMIDEIRAFDADRGQNVNMRVGIHTGKVMCGMVGTRRFKFDVFSNDVTFANEMESSGEAGRVHISQQTADALGGAFPLEPGADYKSTKTYFIVADEAALGDGAQDGLALGLGGLTNGAGLSGYSEHELTSCSHNSNSTAARIQQSFRKISLQKLAGKLRSLPSNTTPPRRGGGGGGGGDGNGSMRLKLADRQAGSMAAATNPRPAHSTQQLPRQDTAQVCLEMDTDASQRKSASLQALHQRHAFSVSLSGTPEHNSSATGGGGGAMAGSVGGGAATVARPGSVANSTKGSRSSGGIACDGCSESAATSAGLEAALSSHAAAAAAASLTHFDTDEPGDLQQRLAVAIHDYLEGADTLAALDGGDDATRSRGAGFWRHTDSLNAWTLQFRDAALERHYRAHFAMSSTDAAARRNPTSGNSLDAAAAARSHVKKTAGGGGGGGGGEASVVGRGSVWRVRYNGQVVDIAVAAVLFVCAELAAVLGLSLDRTDAVRKQAGSLIPFHVYSLFALLVLVLSVLLVAVPLARGRRPLSVQWRHRHILGAVLMALPMGVALSIAVVCPLLGVSGCAQHPLRLLTSHIALFSIFAHANFSQLGAWPKTLQSALMGAIYVALPYWCGEPSDLPSEECRSSANLLSFLPALLIATGLSVLLVAFLNYQFEAAFRLSFFADVQMRSDAEKMTAVRDQADWLLTNILPPHALQSLRNNTRYSENHEETAVLFASITNWNEMYEENFEGGREFLRVLNEVIGDFDELLERSCFDQVEKIKTIGAAYMAASGLNPSKRAHQAHPKEHLYQMVDFALALQKALSVFNEDLLDFDFECKLGLNVGPVTAGVIGSSKLYYDIWGDTVNIASRMYSTGVKNRIQVSEYTKLLLEDRYEFEYRDHIEVKGIDAGMHTYLLVRVRPDAPPLHPDS